MTALALAAPGAAADLAVFAKRVAANDPDTVLRVVARGVKVACFATTPFDVVVMRAAKLAETVECDVVVEAGTLAARASSAREDVVELPPPVPALRWAGPLPPDSGWHPIASVPVAEARLLVEHGIDEFRTRVNAMRESDRSRAALESVAADVWEREVASRLRVRLLHAAARYGFLGLPGDDADLTEIPVYVSGSWTRLDAPYGTVLAREGSALDLFIR
jgi:hypothetical protein